MYYNIATYITFSNGRLLCVFAIRCECFLCVLQVSFATNDYNRSTFLDGATNKNNNDDDDDEKIVTHTHTRQEIYTQKAPTTTTTAFDFFQADDFSSAVSSIERHIPIHKSGVGSINKAFNKCNFFALHIFND